MTSAGSVPMSAMQYRGNRNKVVEVRFEVRGKTRENLISKARLAETGVTSARMVESLESDERLGWKSAFESVVFR